MARSPLLEGFAAKGYEVLLFSDPVDELWLERAPKFKDKPLHVHRPRRGRSSAPRTSASRRADDARRSRRSCIGDLLGCLRVHLQEEIKEVRLSESPDLVAGVPGRRRARPHAAYAADAGAARPEAAEGEAHPGAEPEHPLIPKLQSIFEENPTDPRLKLYAELLARPGAPGRVGPTAGSCRLQPRPRRRHVARPLVPHSRPQKVEPYSAVANRTDQARPFAFWDARGARSETGQSSRPIRLMLACTFSQRLGSTFSYASMARRWHAKSPARSQAYSSA